MSDHNQVTQIFSQSAIDAVMAPVENASGLPNEAFTSLEVFEREKTKLFAHQWVLAGFDRDVPNYGDIVPVEVAGAPLLLVRDKAGNVNVFHNACRHRGMRLIDNPCTGKSRLTCPYHCWAYDLDGQLIARPFFDGKSAKDQALPTSSDLNLVKVRQVRWLDMIFVNLSGDAPEFNDAIQPMTDRLSHYDLSVLGFAGQADFEVACNWKLACENYMENYHVFAVHPKLLNFSPMKGRDAGDWDGQCFSTGYRVDELETGRGEGLPHFPDLTAEMSRDGAWFLFFPNLAIEIFADQLAVFRFIPVAPGITREEIHLYLVGEAATSDSHKTARDTALKTWHDLNLEDIGLLEGLQAGRASPSYKGGVYSSQWEVPCHEFNKKIIEALR